MAKRKIETEFSITGEEAYKQALSEINSGMSVLKSEMRLVAAEFEGNADSIEALTKKHDILGKQHELQKKKVEELEKALTDANEALEKSGGKSQKAAYDVDEYQKKVNYAKAELFKLAHQLADTNAAMEEAAKDTFDALGLSITNVDGTLRNSEDVFFDVIDALGKIENGTERDAMSMEIFGKSAQDLNSLIVQGSGTLKKYTDEAHEMGYVLSGEALDALGAVDDAQQRLLRTQEAVSNQISAEYAPYMEESLTMTRELIQDIGKALTESGAVEAFGSILVSTQSLLRPLAELGMEILPPLAKILGGIAGVMALIADAANVIAGLVTLDFRRIGTALGFNPDQASNMQIWMHGADYKADRWGSAYGNAFDESTGLYSGNYFHASGTDNFPGGWSWVGENGPEKVYLPQGTQIATAQESRSSERNEFNFYIEARSLRELEDLLRIIEDARRMLRMKG